MIETTIRMIPSTVSTYVPVVPPENVQNVVILSLHWSYGKLSII